MLQALVLWCPVLLTLSAFLPISASPVSSFILILVPIAPFFTLLASVVGLPSVHCLIYDFLEWSRVSCVSLKKACHFNGKNYHHDNAKKTDISQETNHSRGALFSFTTEWVFADWMLRQEGWVVRIQHRLELVPENHQRLRVPWDHLLFLMCSPLGHVVSVPWHLCFSLWPSPSWLPPCNSSMTSSPISLLLLHNAFNSYLERSFYFSSSDS